MHLPDTVLLDRPAGVALVVAGGALSLIGLAAGGRGMSATETARAGMVAAFVFVASTIPVPVPPVSTHLGLYGLAGVLLGRRVLLISPIAFGLQALLFGHGGVASVGLNAANMTIAAVLAAGWFRVTAGREPASTGGRLAVASFGAGFLGIAVMAFLVFGELMVVGYTLAAAAAVPIWLATAGLEGVVTVLVLGTLARRYPQLLRASDAPGRVPRT